MCTLLSRIADRTEIGIASLRAQEKSTIKTDSARVALPVSRYTSAVPPKLYGTSLSAQMRCLVFRSGLELFRFLNHLDDAVIASAAGILIDTNYTGAFFDNGTGINIRTSFLAVPAEIRR